MNSIEIIIDGNIVKIDEIDMHLLEGRTWRVYYYDQKKYLKWVCRIDNVQLIISFHRMALGVKDGEIVDHINGDSLDNRRCNLRLVTASQNARNMIKHKATSSKFKGVSHYKGRWRARIKVNNVSIWIGTYGDEAHAAYAYDMASMKYHGEYGRTNFLPLVAG